MPYLFIFAVSVSLAFGGYVGYSINEATVERLEHAVERANLQAINLLHEEQAKTAEAQKKAIKANRELDKAHESSIKTINALHANLSDAIAAKLRAEGAKSHKDAMPTNSGPGSIKETSPGKTGFSEEFAKFLAEKARLADELAIYSDTANKFINNNCGIVYDSGTRDD